MSYLEISINLAWELEAHVGNKISSSGKVGADVELIKVTHRAKKASNSKEKESPHPSVCIPQCGPDCKPACIPA